MLEIYSYEYIRAANDERRTRALDRYEKFYRHSNESESLAQREAEVVEIAFTNGCPESDQISA